MNEKRLVMEIMEVLEQMKKKRVNSFKIALFTVIITNLLWYIVWNV